MNTFWLLPDEEPSFAEQRERLVRTQLVARGMRDRRVLDAIIVTAGVDELPDPYVEQLADDGRIVIPIGATPTSQSLFRFTQQGRELNAENLGRFAFVPLIGKHGWHVTSVSER